MYTNSSDATASKGGYFHLDNKDQKNKWHLRFGVTPNCNFYCNYCAPENGFTKKEELSTKEVEEILYAAYQNGIKRVHWTGGEPTYRKDFEECVKKANDIGYKEQTITTNGYRLYSIHENLFNNGVNRMICSLDTLNKDRFHKITGLNIFDKVLKGLESSVEKLEIPTKMSCCTMRSTLEELPDFIDYANQLNSNSNNKGSLIIKLNQFFPSNPAQLTQKGIDFWKSEVVEENEILDTLSKIGVLKAIVRKKVIGDNPSYNYYQVGDSNVIVGVLAMYTWKYRCGGCHKLRVKPNGDVSVCITTPESDVTLKGVSLENKIKLIEKAMLFREGELEIQKPIKDRVHYNAQLGGQRFGKVGIPKEIEEFY